MINYNELNQLIAMDFSQMRVLKTDSGYAASNEAITAFVTGLSNFFAQFRTIPNREVLEEYQRLMTLLTEAINESEVNYYRNKYEQEGKPPEEVELLAQNCCLESFKKIPGLMQFWAADKDWGGAIRNAEQHAAVVKKMNEWARKIAPPHVQSSLFNQEASPTPDEPPSSSKRKLSF
jgi:hypothetical protein